MRVLSRDSATLLHFWRRDILSSARHFFLSNEFAQPLMFVIWAPVWSAVSCPWVVFSPCANMSRFSPEMFNSVFYLFFVRLFFRAHVRVKSRSPSKQNSKESKTKTENPLGFVCGITEWDNHKRRQTRWKPKIELEWRIWFLRRHRGKPENPEKNARSTE